MSNQPSPGSAVPCCEPLTRRALPASEAGDLARAFKALGDPVRLQLFSLIASADDEVCVCDLTCSFEVSAPTISHHLKTLRTAGLVTSERRGTWVYYRVVPERVGVLSQLLAPEPAVAR
ncbi:ArsR/SmtB family transcription factor [Cumulibacter manganitolerans]|uniref:ArsR/SmtB family transcription factor n=1 Tax=Cumulibacter manganitolerans TaxID=1884992 RepID=UPI00129708F8|nr:metalloregulator ArsR/SmtB family transcription factor [Cumulibacter manganitolerans]